MRAVLRAAPASRNRSHLLLVRDGCLCNVGTLVGLSVLLVVVSWWWGGLLAYTPAGRRV